MNNILNQTNYFQYAPKDAKKLFILKKGFTLIELIVVIAVLAIIAAIAIPVSSRIINNARISKMITDCKTIENAAKLHYADTNEWPRIQKTHPTLYKPTGDLSSLMTKYGDIKNWNGPYLSSIPKNEYSQYGYMMGVLTPKPQEFITNSSGYTYAKPFDKGDYVLYMNFDNENDFIFAQKEIDKMIDNQDGAASGKIQWSEYYYSIKWVIQKDVSNVKSTDGTLQHIFSR